MKKLLLSVAILVAMTSCATYEYVPQTTTTTTTETHLSYSEASTRIVEGRSSFAITPVIADLKVSDKKITHVEIEAFADFNVTRNVINNIETYKSIALCRAAKVHNADVLVGVEIEVETVERHLVITVTGYPAKYTKFRNATEKDLSLVNTAKLTDKGIAIVANPQDK